MPQNPLEIMNSMFMQMNTNMMQMAESLAPHNVIPGLLKGGAEVAKTVAEAAPVPQYKTSSFAYYPQGQYYQYGNKIPIF